MLRGGDGRHRHHPLTLRRTRAGRVGGRGVQRRRRSALRGRRVADHGHRAVGRDHQPGRILGRNHAEFPCARGEFGRRVGGFDLALQRGPLLGELAIELPGVAELVAVLGGAGGQQQRQRQTAAEQRDDRGDERDPPGHRRGGLRQLRRVGQLLGPHPPLGVRALCRTGLHPFGGLHPAGDATWRRDRTRPNTHGVVASSAPNEHPHPVDVPGSPFTRPPRSVRPRASAPAPRAGSPRSPARRPFRRRG